MNPFRRRVRAAIRLGELWRRGDNGEFDYAAHEQRLRDYLADVQRGHRRYREARRRGWSCAAAAITRELRWEAEAFERYFRVSCDQLRASPADHRGVRHWLGELDELDAEFGGWDLDRHRELSVETQSIALEEEDLGRFRIVLRPEALARSSGPDGFSIIALDPNPASGNESVTHPHVRDERLCAGDAHDAIDQALSDGRLADAFILVRSVLLTYNPHSPYVSLEAWNGPDCDDCGSSVSDDEAGGCDSCGCVLCPECQWHCARCGAARCGGCADSCAVCSDRFCRRCLESSAISDRDVCPDCRLRCAGCGRLVAEDEFDADAGRCEECAPPEAATTESDAAAAPVAENAITPEDPREPDPTTPEPALAATAAAADV